MYTPAGTLVRLARIFKRKRAHWEERMCVGSSQNWDDVLATVHLQHSQSGGGRTGTLGVMKSV